MGEQKEQTNNAEQEKKTEQKQKAEWTKRIAQIKKSIGQVKKIIKTVTEYAEKAWDAAEESMDLTGAMNHLGSQMDKIGNTFAKDYKKYGYASAEGYAKSFKERIDKLNTQMTGYGMDGENATGLPQDAGLGMDPKQLAEFQVKIGSIAEASGMAGENILAMQKAMSMLSVDLASFSAVDTDQVMTDLTNALNGQSDALDRYGIQLSDAMLNQYAYAAGAGALSASMTQQQQMQLRMLGILEQSSFAWGDQISKINSAASQYRIFQQQMTGLTRVIGNLFIPVAQAVLPVLNGMLIALNRVLTAIGFSAWGDNWLTDISASVGGGIGNVEKLTESIDKTEIGLKDASTEAKKLRYYLMGIDELNVMEPEGSSNGNGHGNNSSSSGINFDFIGDSFGNYESVWNTALSGMKNKAQVFADEVGKILAPLSAVFENLFSGNFFGAGKETSNLVSGIFNWIADAIDKVDWQGLGRRIGEFLAGINWVEILSSAGKVILNVIKGWGELMGAMMGKSPVIGGYVFFKGTFGLLETISKSKTMEGIAEKWSKASAVFKGLGKGVWEAAKDVEKGSAKIIPFTKLKEKIEGSLAKDIKEGGAKITLFPGVKEDIKETSDALEIFGGKLNIKKFVSNCKDALEELRNNLTLVQKGLISVATVFAEYNMLKDPFKELALGSDNLVGNIGKIAGVATLAGGALYALLGPIGIAIAGVTAFIAAVNGVRQAVDGMTGRSIAEVLVGDISLEDFTENFTNSMNEIAGGFDLIIQKGKEVEETKKQVSELVSETDKMIEFMSKGAYSIEEKAGQVTQSLYSVIEQSMSAVYEEYDLLINGLDSSNLSEGNIAALRQIRDEQIESYTLLKEKLDELNAQWEESSISAEEYQRRLGEISTELKVAGQNTDGGVQALTEFQEKAQQIDFSSFLKINEDGSTSTNLEQLIASLKTLTDVYAEGSTKINEANQIYTDSMNHYMESAQGDSATMNELASALASHNEEVRAAKESMGQSLTDYADAMQYQLVERIPDVIEGAQKTWGEMNWLSQAFSGFKNEDDYVKNAVEEYLSSSVNPALEEMKTYFDEMGMEGAVWASDFTDTIVEALFGEGLDGKVYGQKYSYGKLAEDYVTVVQSSLEEAKPGLTEKMSETAKNTLQGYTDGISQNSEEVSLAVDRLVQVNIKERMQERLEIHSPSKVFESYGDYTIAGFIAGLDSQQENLSFKIMNLVMMIQGAFSGLRDNFSEIGSQIIWGLQAGLVQTENVVYEEAKKIATNISDIIREALAINSPSRVMYSLGRYVTQGLKCGMESLYGETESSLINFAGRLKTDFPVGMGESTLGEQKLWEKSGNIPLRSHYTEYSTQTIVSYLQELILVSRETNREITRKELNVNIGDRAIARANLKGEKGLGMRIISG